LETVWLKPPFGKHCPAAWQIPHACLLANNTLAYPACRSLGLPVPAAAKLIIERVRLATTSLWSHCNLKSRGEMCIHHGPWGSKPENNDAWASGLKTAKKEYQACCPKERCLCSTCCPHRIARWTPLSEDIPWKLCKLGKAHACSNIIYCRAVDRSTQDTRKTQSHFLLTWKTLGRHCVLYSQVILS